MRTSLLRHAAATRVALAAGPARTAFRASSVALAISRAPRTAATAAVYRPASSLLRFYSSESAAAQHANDAEPKLITSFADLPTLGVHERLVKTITDDMQYHTMTDVQSMTINPALAGKDVVAQAKTGTGKTLAFLVPIVQRIIAGEPELAYRQARRARSDDIRAIILSPTRELAEQIGAEAKKLCSKTGVVVQTAVGGTQKQSMLQQTWRQGCHLMIATPGRLHDLLSDPTSKIDAPRLSALVLDEADRMMDVGFKDELESILSFLPHRDDVPRQTLLYSATMPKNVVSLARQYIDPKNFEFIQTVRADEVPTHERVPQFIVPCRGFENLAPTLLELIQRGVRSTSDGSRSAFKAIVFLPTTASVVYYSQLFRNLRFGDRSLPYVWDIHSKLTQARRTKSAQDFRTAQSGILFSSDVSARGMDFPNVSHVIQVHLPQDRDIYIHRIGRTGRAGKGGEAYLLVSDAEVPVARERLPALPIARSTDFECAAVDVTAQSDALPALFENVKAAAKHLPPDILNTAYGSLLGSAMKGVRPQDLVNEVNNLAKYTWGLSEPPTVSPKILQLFGGRVSGLRVGDRPMHSMRRPDAGRDFGRRRGSDDGFSMMERLSQPRRSYREHRPSSSF